ncbi:MAG: hypothetical protein RXR31_03175 [Thermoproteota archaeon]
MDTQKEDADIRKEVIKELEERTEEINNIRKAIIKSVSKGELVIKFPKLKSKEDAEKLAQTIEDLFYEGIINYDKETGELYFSLEW